METQEKPSLQNLPETQKRPWVALLVTCLVDAMRPNIGFASVKLLEEAGCNVAVPVQSCCGQPAYNSGDQANARALALAMMDAFEGYDYVVAPSGSCAGMVIKHYPKLFVEDPPLRQRAEALAAKTHELTHFLFSIRGMRRVSAKYDGVITYHDSCSGLRELGIKSAPRALLASMAGVELREMTESETCCGFGGAFAVKYGEISDRIVQEKADHVQKSAADMLVAGDLGCLMNIAGKLSRQGSTIEVRHVAEVLAGAFEVPPIGVAVTDKKTTSPTKEGASS